MEYFAAIALNKGKWVLLDIDDFYKFSTFKWFISTTGYAKRNLKVEKNKWKGSFMHKEILPLKSNLEVDHINGDRLDNRRDNLRGATRSQNNMNKFIKTSKNTSKYKGVCYDKNRGTYNSKLQYNHKTINLGRYKTEEDAAKAYDKRAKELFGEFAILNFKEDT